MNKLKKYKTWYRVFVQFENFAECFEVLETDVLAACRSAKKKIASDPKYAGDYCITECVIYK